MLLDGRLGGPAAQLLDIGRHRKRIDVMQLQLPVFAPAEELFRRARIGGARVAVTDAGGKEFNEAAADALAAAADDGWQRLQARPNQGRRRPQRLGQQDRRSLRHLKVLRPSPAAINLAQGDYVRLFS